MTYRSLWAIVWVAIVLFMLLGAFMQAHARTSSSGTTERHYKENHAPKHTKS